MSPSEYRECLCDPRSEEHVNFPYVLQQLLLLSLKSLATCPLSIILSNIFEAAFAISVFVYSAKPADILPGYTVRMFDSAEFENLHRLILLQDMACSRVLPLDSSESKYPYIELREGKLQRNFVLLCPMTPILRIKHVFHPRFSLYFTLVPTRCSHNLTFACTCTLDYFVKLFRLS